MKNANYNLEERTQFFAKNVRIFVRKLPETLANKEDIPQLIRSSGSVAANYIEANESLGRKDFLMRIRICLKESKESAFWLTMLDIGSNSEYEEERTALYDEARQLLYIFSSVLRSAKSTINS